MKSIKTGIILFMFSILFTWTSATIVFADISIDEETFPDFEFREYICETIDKNGDSILSEDEIEDVHNMSLASKGIMSLEGIEYFENLTELDCSSNELSELDISKNDKLTYLNCENNYLSCVNTDNNINLEHLFCAGNTYYVQASEKRIDLSLIPGFDVNKTVDWSVGSINGTELILADDIEETVKHIFRGKVRYTYRCSADYAETFTMDIYISEPVPDIPITGEYFPDSVFRGYVSAFDRNSNGILEVYEADSVTSLNCTNKNRNRIIHSLEGIEHFRYLRQLLCAKNSFTSLDLSQNLALEELDCSYNYEWIKKLDLSYCKWLKKVNCYSCTIQELNVGNCTLLEELRCDDNLLSYIDVSKCISLSRFICNNNRLLTLDLSNNTGLTYLKCGNNEKMTDIDLHANSALTYLECYNTSISDLDISNNTNLVYLNCQKTKIESLNTSNNIALEELVCDNNDLINLDLGNNVALRSLNCTNNQLSNLDVGNNNNLEILNCSNNKIESLELSHNRILAQLYCSQNHLKTIDVTNNAALTILGCSDNELVNLDVSNNTALEYLYCSKNQITSLIVNNNSSLIWLECYDNSLENLDVSNNKLLDALKVQNNRLRKLEVNGASNLGLLMCSNNCLKTLNVSACRDLTILRCDNNELESLDLFYNTALTSLYCSNCSLTNLDLSQNTSLTNIDAAGNVYHFTTSENDIDLARFPGHFDVNRASNWNGATVEGALLSINNTGSNIVTYDYDLGNGKSETFKLDITLTENILIDETHFPDPAFREYVSEYIDSDKDGAISLDEAEIVTTINARIQFPGVGTAKSLKGIEYFSNLHKLVCGTVRIFNLDISKNTAITELDCSRSGLETLDISNNHELIKLNCSYNNLSILDISQNPALTELNCESNNLSDLDVSNNKELETLNCQYNNLSNLDVSENGSLKILICGGSILQYLDVSNNTNLTELFCKGAGLETLDLSNNSSLQRLVCTGNNISSLDLENNIDLKYLDCSSNDLTGIDVSSCTYLNNLICNDNSLTDLDVTRNRGLKYLSCTGNSLNALDLSQNPELTDLYCERNELAGLDVRNNVNLKRLYVEKNRHKVTSISNMVDLRELPGEFDSSRTSDWKNGTLNGYMLIIGQSDEVTYTYDLGNGHTATFALVVTSENPYIPQTSNSTATSNSTVISDEVISDSGRCGDDLTWNLENGILTISGTGDMYDYSDERAPWTEYRSYIEEIQIASGVRSICSDVFSNYDQLKKLSVADGVSYIGNMAYGYCYALSEVHFLGDAPIIDGSAFNGDSFKAYYPKDNMTWTDEVRQGYGGNITWIPYDPAIVPVELFHSTLILPAGTTTIESEAFSGLTQGVNIVIPDTVTFIADDAFADSKVVIVGEAESYVEEYANRFKLPFSPRE